MIGRPGQTAVVFDLDGVIVDTIASLYRGYLQILEGFGAVGSSEEFDRLNGSNLDEIVAHLAREHELGGRESEIRERFETSFRQLYTHIDLMPGVVEVLEALRAEGFVIGLASSAARGPIDEVLGRFGLESFFEPIVSGDEVARAKPDPEIYRLAKERCGGTEHFVVEDSRNGIRAALGAGWVAIRLRSGEEPRIPEACYEIRELSELLEIVAESSVVLSRAEHIELVREGVEPSVPERDARRADEIWQEALLGRPSLFDGLVATYQGHETLADGTLRVACSPSPYRFVFARLHDRGLRLPAPIGVSAVVVDPGSRLLLGKRSHQVSEYPGCYELVPSGGIPVEKMTGRLFLEQIETALVEETGLGLESVAGSMPLGLVYDRKNRVYDLCVRIQLRRSPSSSTLRSAEYDEFQWLGADQLEESAGRSPLVPTSAAILRLLQRKDD